MPWSKLSLKELLDFIEQDHRRIREKLLKLQTLLEQSTGKHSETKNSMFSSLCEFFPVFKTVLENHFVSEEQLLIPYIRQMDEFDRGIGTKPEFQRSSIKNPISLLENDHDQTENVMFAKIHTIISGHQLQAGPDDALVAICESLKEIQAILSEHIHIENDVLFPLAIELELRLMHKK